MESYQSSVVEHHPGQYDPGFPPDRAAPGQIFLPLIKSEFKLVQIPPHTLVLEKEHQVSQVGYICRGTVDLMVIGKDGRTYRKGMLGKGDFFGLELLFDQGMAFYDAVALDFVDCYIIDSKRLAVLLADMPELKSYMEEVLLETMKRFLRSPVVSENTDAGETAPIRPGRFDKAIAYIDTHYMNPLNLDDIARKSGLSRFYFSRMFKRETGHSFKDYLNITRIEAAKRLLVLPDMNISQTCYSVGFNDVSYFARIFKRYEKISPSAYKKDKLAGR